MMARAYNQHIINCLIQMHHQGNSHYGNPLESRVKQLQTENGQLQGEMKQLLADKQGLSAAIEELNLCYQQKIVLLEATIAHQHQRYEEILDWKQSYVNRGLIEVEKYEAEIKKMIDTLDNAHTEFESKQAILEEEISEYRMKVDELRE
jgi:DNA repair exonuclease SbcCD ATPase subunit